MVSQAARAKAYPTEVLTEQQAEVYVEARLSLVPRVTEMVSLEEPVLGQRERSVKAWLRSII